MNWKRGLFRGWVVFTALWLIGVAVVWWLDVQAWEYWHHPNGDIRPHLGITQADVFEHAFEPSPALWKYALAGALGPFAGAALALAALWVMRGFRS